MHRVEKQIRRRLYILVCVNVISRKIYALLSEPDDLPRPYKRAYIAYQYSGISAYLYHFLFFPFFLIQGYYWGLWGKALSVVLWTLALILLRRRKIHIAIAFAFGELCIKALLAVRLFGVEPDMHLFLFTIPLYLYLLPAGHHAMKVSFLAMCAASMVGIELIAYTTEPLYLMSPELVLIVSAVNLMIFTAVVSFAVYFYRVYADKIEDEIQLSAENSRQLLENILPGQIISRLQNGERTVVDSYPDCSILFCDIVNFTKISRNISPRDLVGILNGFFTEIDGICEDLGLEKIKTIGDAYMITSGVPESYPDHADRAARCALRIMSAVRSNEILKAHRLNVRIGIHSGPVVGGVIGRKKFSFDLWGETVNVAARLESYGLAGRIHTSRKFRDLLVDRYAFERRRSLKMKGMDSMETYFLLERRESDRPAGRTKKRPGAKAGPSIIVN
jgi:adenylate cyclase